VSQEGSHPLDAGGARPGGQNGCLQDVTGTHTTISGTPTASLMPLRLLLPSTAPVGAHTPLSLHPPGSASHHRMKDRMMIPDGDLVSSPLPPGSHDGPSTVCLTVPTHWDDGIVNI